MIVGFLATILAILFIIHAIIYFALVYFFGIDKKENKRLIIIVLTVLSVSFVASAIFVRLSENIFTIAYYFISGIWLGFVINILLVLFFVLMVLALLRLFKKSVQLKIVGIIMFIIAGTITLMGVWNVFHPVVKQVEIEIPNLPEQWNGKTIVQLSDVHLGAVLGGKFLDTVIEKANNLNPELVVITGDLFDGMVSHVDDLSSKLDNIQAKQGVYYVTGNHETYIGLQKVLDTLGQTKVNVLADKMVNIEGLQLLGINYPDMQETKNINKIVESWTDYDPDKPSILLYHAPTSIGQSGTGSHGDIYFGPNTDFSGTEALGIDLQLSGHTHQGQIFPFTIIAKKIYRGYDNGLNNFGELMIYTSSGTGVWGPTMRTGSKSEITVIKLKK